MEDGWNSICNGEREEKHKCTRSLDPPFEGRVSTVEESARSVEDNSVSEIEGAQKQVTKRISYRADERAGRRAS